MTSCGPDEAVYWPKGATPQTSVPFRGLEISGQPRSWEETPYPERLGLALEAVDRYGPNAFITAVSYMAKRLGRTPPPQHLRDELAALFREAVASKGAVSVF